MGAETLLLAQTGIGAFNAGSGYFGAKNAQRIASYQRQTAISAATTNFHSQSQDLDRQFLEVAEDEASDSTALIRDARGRLATVSNSFGLLDSSSRFSIFSAEAYNFNEDGARLDRNYSRQREAIKSGRKANAANFQNAVTGATNNYINASAQARNQRTQALLSGASTIVGGIGNYQNSQG